MTAGLNPAELDLEMIGAMAMHSNTKTQSRTPADVANIALFLASDESHALTCVRPRFVAGAAA